MTAAVAIIPYADRLPEGLRALPLDRLSWPLGRPDRLRAGTVRDMAAGDHLITFPKTRLYLARPIAANLSLMIIEPDSVHRKHLRLARLFQGRFHRIFTKNAELLAHLPNARKLIHGTTMIDAPETLDTVKTADCSLIASARGHLAGHKLRHAMVAHIRARALDIEIMGRGYRAFGPKAEGLAPYRYSIVIENSVEPSYFTEKIVDACLCRTVPIYWGAPDITKYFNPEGVIACADFAGLCAALDQISPQDYARRSAAISDNYSRALDYADLEGRAARLALGS